MALVFVFVCTKDKPTKPPIPENPGYYYPRQKDYSWRYINLGPGCDADAIYDSFDLTILGASNRHGNVGFDRFRPDINDTNFIYEKADTLFLEKVGQGVPLFKILVGPIRAGTFWTDNYFEYLIQGFENVTLPISGVTYKRCAKIMKRNRNLTKPNKIYEWWVPEFGKVKEIEVDSSSACVRGEELRYFSPSGVMP